MLKLISHLFYQILFTCSFILGVQLPEFMQQYIQRLSGHVDELMFQLSQFQVIADLQFKGNLSEMVSHYRSNSDPSISQTGDIIGGMQNRLSLFEQQLTALLPANEINIFKASADNAIYLDAGISTNHLMSNYPDQLYAFITQFDKPIAEATFKTYQLAMPLNLSALSTGFIFSVSVVALVTLLFSLFRWLIFRIRIRIKAV